RPSLLSPGDAAPLQLTHVMTLATAEAKKPRPSADGPVSSETACSGCGIRPTTLPSALHTPAMPAAEPLGLPPAYLMTTWPDASHKIWHPLQMPSTGRPTRAAGTSSLITGANLAIAPQRR